MVLKEKKGHYPLGIGFPPYDQGLIKPDSGSEGQRFEASQARNVFPHTASEIIGLGSFKGWGQFACVCPDSPAITP